MIDELLAPLAPEDPTDEEIRQLLARADRRTRRRRIRIAAATATAAVAVTATLAALPSDPKAPLTAGSLLRTAAALAADQPGPTAWTGYRYVRQVERRTAPTFTFERTDESWTASDWQGLRISGEGRIVAGHLPTGESRVLRPMRLQTPEDMPNLYGDGPLAKVPLSELPTDPARLGALLIDAHKDGRWTPGGSWNPLPANVKYDVLRDILLLLTESNTTPAQRAALITVLRNYQGVTPLESVQDQRGRTGRGVDIPTGRATVRVIFSPDTSELLEWSEPGEIHTYVGFDHVAALPD
jgi:hypothetical protein